MSFGYVYVLSNPSMPGAVKIGRSRLSGSIRSKQLYTTGVPTPFVLEFEIYITQHEQIEAAAHRRLQDERTNGSREFFRVDPGTAIEVILDSIYRMPFDSSLLTPEEVEWVCNG